MLVAQDFLKLIVANLKAISHITVPTHRIGKSQVIEVADEEKFVRKTWLTLAYVIVMVVQWIHGYSLYPRSF